ncbi:hypothetical protein PVNG_05248 [Plasmodium vivax North Korean]|uniref:Variable surface protein n=1 Tax=Plasmodium vivax North Korean TaxID=1035514 RepID=A0A0J9TT33_PLAVI|nr:hypothetical protein PVNG_05248 [Plasmodium vivax North Korean]
MVKRFDNQYTDVTKICTKIAKNLTMLFETNDIGDSKERCNYFMYWTYYIISKMINDNSKIIGNLQVVQDLLDVVKKINYTIEEKNKCNFDYNLEITFDEVNEMKDLHDYFKNFSSIVIKFPSYVDETNKFCEYITYINTLYEKYVRGCCTCYSANDIYCEEHCPNYFKCDEMYNPYTMYTKFKCVEKLKNNIKKIDIKVPIDSYVKWLTNISKEKPYLIKWDNGDSSNILEPIDNNPSYDLFNIVTIIVFSILVLFLIFFIFYKVYS